MINERTSAQPNTPTSANMQYGYPPSHFDMINMQTMQNPSDLYSYYPASLYPSFGTFDDHNQWGSADTTGNVPPPPPGPMQFHPQMYTPSPLEIPRNPFDYPPPHAYPHYHPGFTTSTFAGPPSTGTSGFDMPWNPHSLPMQQIPVAPQQMTPIGGGPTTNKKPSVYDDYPSGGVGDMLAQHMNAVDLGTSASNDDAHNYDNGTNDTTSNLNVLSSKEQQQHYQSNSSNLSLSSRPNQALQSSVPSGPKSYASVVSADTLINNNKVPSSASNISLRTTGQSTPTERHNNNNNNNPTSNFSNDSNNSRSNTNFRGSNNNNNNTNNYSQQTRNGSSGYTSRNQQQQQQQQPQPSSSGNGGFLSWTNSSFSSNSRAGNNNNNNTSSTYYNSGSSNYYDRPSYSQQQNSTSNNNNNNNNNKRQNSNYQQNYSSSRTANNMSNGNVNASAMTQQPMSAANQELLETLKRTHQYNPKDFNLNPKGARFFVIKSYSEDDVHRSIKYNIWCSTEHGNKRLDNAFREREGKGPIYLFFSVNASGHFCGMAEMMSPVDYEHKTDVWQMSNKWQGKFEVKWIYVKDVPNQQFRNIRLENNDNKPVTNSRDTQEIPYEKGKLMLKTMHMYRDKTSIFDDFQYYESKQAEEATTNLTMNNSSSSSPSTTAKKNSNNDFNNNNNNNMNYSRGNNSNKRQYSANKTSANQSEQQQHQQQQNEDIENDNNN